MPKRTVVAPRLPRRHVRITCDKPGETVNMVFTYTNPDGEQRLLSFNQVRGIVHRANGSVGIIDLHGVRQAEVNRLWTLALVNMETSQVKDWASRL